LKRRNFFACFAVSILIGLALAAAAPAQEGMGTPAAKALVEQAEAARKTGDYAKAVAAFRKAIDLDPDFVEAHSSFMFVSGTLALTSLPARKAWAANTTYSVGDIVTGGKSAQRCVTAGTSGKQEPAWNATGQTPDGAVLWQVMPREEEQALRDKAEEQAVDKYRAELRKIYEAWAKEHPGKAVYQWALGYLYDYKDRALAEKYYRRALELDPKFARALHSMSLYEEFRGNEQSSRDYLKKAADANPQDPQYFFYYIQKLRDDRATYRKLTNELAARFPAHERGAQGLYWLAETADTAAEKIATLERLRAAYPPEKFSWSDSGMSLLFEAYSAGDAAKALALAQEMARLLPKAKEWQTLSAYQQNIIQARSLLAEKKFADARALLEKTTGLSYVNQNPLHLLKAEAADGAGETAKAYDGLAKLVAREPNDELSAALRKYAGKLGKTAEDVNAEIWKAREQDAKPAPEFSLGLYTEKRNVSLADYKDKIVMLNFWYPG